MSEKEIAKIENSILQARKEGLLKASDTTMNSHGKLWGMDVFSWINPNPVVLSATMESFPFPILFTEAWPLSRWRFSGAILSLMKPKWPPS